MHGSVLAPWAALRSQDVPDISEVLPLEAVAHVEAQQQAAGHQDCERVQNALINPVVLRAQPGT